MVREHTIKTRLSLSYILYILLFVLFITLLSNILIQSQFKKYSLNKQKNQIESIQNQISTAYQGKWIVDRIEGIGSYALDNGYIISLVDQNENSIYNANIHHGHMCQLVKEDIRIRMFGLNPNWNGEYITNSIPVMSDGQVVGTLNIEYFNYFYSEDDVLFLATLNKLYLFSSLVFIIIAIILGTYISNVLSKPIEKVVKAAEKLSNGIYDKINDKQSNLKEINALNKSINNLSSNLLSQEQIRKQLTSDVTHELRTPLTTLQTHIEAMMDGVLDPNVEELKSIHEEIIRLGKIVSDLDRLFRFDNNTVKLNKEMVNIADVINNVVNITKTQFNNKNVNLISNLKNIEVYIDKDKICQVIVNLLSNALKYTPQNGEVKITVSDLQQHITIQVIDSGIGISKEDLPYIFERFYRADKSRNRETGGSGIGLTIVKSIITAHQGNIKANSQLGKGTEIIIGLPKYKI